MAGAAPGRGSGGEGTTGADACEPPAGRAVGWSGAGPETAAGEPATSAMRAIGVTAGTWGAGATGGVVDEPVRWPGGAAGSTGDGVERVGVGGVEGVGAVAAVAEGSAGVSTAGVGGVASRVPVVRRAMKRPAGRMPEIADGRRRAARAMGPDR